MISLYYPALPESSGAEAHRRGLLQGFRDCGIRCIARNQLSRFESLRFVFDALAGRILYIRMNGHSSNVRWVLRLLHWLRKEYILEVNAPYQEDHSELKFYARTVGKACFVVCVSSVLKTYLRPYNQSVLAVSNGGVVAGLKMSRDRVSCPHVLFIYNARWQWQSAENVVRVASSLAEYDLTLKVVDVANGFKRSGMPSNVEVVKALSHDEYLSALMDASGFYLEYRPVQDRELGFYGDSLKFRDYWNTRKPILVSGPKMNWAPNPQTPELGVFTLENFSVLGESGFDMPFNRQPYTWTDACLRILDSSQFKALSTENITIRRVEKDRYQCLSG